MMSDKFTYAYIKYIKRYMLCPSCNDKLRFDKKSLSWCCKKCGYSLTEAEFLDDYVFWFCDECNAFMNKQVGFDKNKEFWECTECGYKNDISENNIYDICKDCGAKLTENDKHGLCSKCQTARNEEWVSRLKTGLKIFGSIAAAGTIYLVAKVSAENNSDTDYFDDSEDVENPEIEKSKVHLFKATKLGWDEEKEGVWFDSDDFTFEEAKQEFKEYQGTTYRGYPYTGYEYDGQKYHDVTYLGEFEEDELPHNDTELLDILLKKHNDRK